MRVAVESLLLQRVDAGFEIVVVDDGSSDATAAVLLELTEHAPVPMRVVRTEGVGVPAARNLGAKAAAGRWIAYFDDDQIASSGWLQALLVTAEQTRARCVGGALALRLPAGAPVDLLPRTRALLGEHLLGDRVRRYPRRHLPASNNVLIERELFLQVGGFDERFVHGGSDTDLFGRVREAGVAIWFAPEARAEHVIPARRLRPEFLRWTSLKVGAASARILRKQRGPLARLMAVVMRSAATVMRDLPALVLAKVIGSRTRLVETQCSLWYSQGLMRGLAAGWAPQRMGGTRFLEGLDFRRHGGERPVRG